MPIKRIILIAFLFLFNRNALAYTVYDATADGIIPTLADLNTSLDTACSNAALSCSVLGASAQGNNIRLIVVSHANDAKTIFIEAVIHGSEKMGALGILSTLHYLINNPNAVTTTKLVFIPVVNPDGYLANTRKNNNVAAGRTVDLNRNFTKGWSNTTTDQSYAASSAPENIAYYGPSPLSEPESQLVAYALRKYKPNKFISVHVGGPNQIYYDPDIEGTTPPNAINTQVTSDGFGAYDLASTSIAKGEERSFALGYGAEAYNIEMIVPDTEAANTEDINRLVSALIFFANRTTTFTWKPQTKLVGPNF